MENFFLTFQPKHQSTAGQRMVMGITNMVLVGIQLIPLSAIIGFGFRLGFGG